MSFDPVLLLFALPGFVGVWSFRKFFGAQKHMGEWAWTCWSIIWGIIIYGAWEWLMRDQLAQLPNPYEQPAAAAIALVILTLLFMLSMRFIVGVIQFALSVIRGGY